MVKYIAKTEIGGIEIRLIHSEHGYVVLYGMERKAFTPQDKALAVKNYKQCVDHAFDLI